MKRSVVLLSAGLDSTTNLYLARQASEVLLCLTFDYGQRAAVREIERAKQIASLCGVQHKTLSLPWFADFTHSALVSEAAQIPQGAAVDIEDLGRSQQTAQAVWVPNRNGIFLNIAAAFAEGLGADWIVPGFNVEEAATFPDNSADFVRASTAAFYFSTANHVEVRCFTENLNKAEIIRKARELAVPLELIWPCYFANESPCGKCESCLRWLRAKEGMV